MVRQSQERLAGNEAFEGFAIDLIAEIAEILSKADGEVENSVKIFHSRVQLHAQVGGRRGVRVHEQGDRGVERSDGRTVGPGIEMSGCYIATMLKC